MKITITFLLILFWSLTVVAQNTSTPMSEQAFVKSMEQLEEEFSDLEKMELAEKMLNENHLSAAQLKQVLKEFDFERQKEQLAKMAYPRVYDPNNFYQIYSTFDFDDTRKRLKAWSNTQPHYGNNSNSAASMGANNAGSFERAYHQLQSTTFDTDKWPIAQELVDNNYLYAEQVSALVTLFDFKTSEDKFARYAYPKTYDPQNYHLVVDALTFPSSKQSLSNWIQGQPRPNPNNGSVNNDPNWNANNNNNPYGNNDPNWNSNNNNDPYGNNDPNWNSNNNNDPYGNNDPNWNSNNNNDPYGNNDPNWNTNNNNSPYGNNSPNWNSNNNNTSSNNNNPNNNSNNNNNPYGNNNSTGNNTSVTAAPVSSTDFINISNQLHDIPNDRDRLVRAKQISDQVSWKSEQVRELMELFLFENSRLDFAIYAYHHTSDVQNYGLVRDALAELDKQQQLVAYIQSVGGTLDNNTSNANNGTTVDGNNNNNSNNGGVAVLTDNDFQTAKAAVERYSSDNDRLNAAKSIIEEQYLNSNQVAQLVELFVFDDVRLDFAKLAYPKTQDQENYNQVIVLMQNTSSQEALRQYINNN
ncbi:MAG: DUF4476 domain-containing protein [Aureispira sp.]